jgi:hypothetical protein
MELGSFALGQSGGLNTTKFGKHGLLGIEFCRTGVTRLNEGAGDRVVTEASSGVLGDQIEVVFMHCSLDASCS